jgi:membrane associated rhomboid family serine protease
MDAKVMLDFESYDFHKELHALEDDEVTLGTLTTDIFPYYRLRSFVTASVLTHVILYVINVLLILAEDKPFETGTYSSMVDALECYPYEVSNWQLYRVFTSLLIVPTMDSLIAHTVFNLMVMSFIEDKLGFRETVILYYGTGVVGNLFSILMTDNPIVSSTLHSYLDVGSFSLFIMSLALEYRLFKTDLYKDYENYRQPVGLFLYKGAIYCFLVYHYTAYEDYANFYMFLGGVLVTLFAQFTSSSVVIAPMVVLGGLAFLQYREPSF